MLSLALSACGGGSSNVPNSVRPSPSPSPSPTPTPTPTGSFNQSAFTCPSSDTAASAARSSGLGEGVARRVPAARSRGALTADGLLAVTYEAQALSSSRATLAAREQALGASLVNEYAFPHAGVTTRILSVTPSQAAAVEAALRSQSGVRSVGPVGLRYPTTVTSPYYPNDPYFNGFTAAQNTSEGNSAPATYHVAPYLESQNVPGQWGMHAVQLEYAFGYSVSGNAPVTNANAVGSSSVKIALIDTGQDTTHPELGTSKVVYQKCFITNPNGSQSTSNFTTDPWGHGTDVAGIAAAATNNALGFTGAGGNSVIYGYRIFPTPDDNCASNTTSDVQCSATTADIASAIADAIAHNVNVISLSLGGGSCNNGVDDDTTEGHAIQEALANNIVVVAAAGNSPGQLEAPACDTNVIAVGASALADGQPNGAGNSSGSASSPKEYVASYSAYGSPGTSLHLASAWGIVAPGGDPVASGNDADELHWIENIWTSQPYQANANDDNFTADTCGPDYGTLSGTSDCRVEIAGTSMATPVVAGAAALIIAAGGSAYQSPTAMKALLCQTADDISDPNEGCGRINIYRAMAYALNDPNKPPF
jgi:hypothetical protein